MPAGRPHSSAESRKTDADDLLATVAASRRPIVRQILNALIVDGVWLETPEGARTDYVNVRPSNDEQEYRLFSVHRRSGRVQFGKYSYSLARELGLTSCFDQLNDDIAATNPLDELHARAIVELARAELRRRRTGS
jgi:hypothetical protein